MTEPSPTSGSALTFGESAARELRSPSRRTVVIGSAFAVPAIALTATTPASAASNDSDLTLSYFQLQNSGDSAKTSSIATQSATTAGNITTKDGLPLYQADQTPFVDFTVYNAGTGTSSYTGIQLDFDANYVSAVTAPSGWTETNRYTNGGRFVSVLNYAGGGLPAGNSASGRVLFKVRPDAPGGTNQSIVNAYAEPTAGDKNPGNNLSTAKFFVNQSQGFDLAFPYFALQSDVSITNGRPTYGPDQNPFIDFTIKNSGSVPSPSTEIQIDWASAYVASATAPDGWTVKTSYFNGDRIVYVFSASTGPLAAGASVSGRVRYTIQSSAPSGTNVTNVTAVAQPTSGDSTSSNNTTSSTYYVTQGKQYDLSFPYFALQSDVSITNGRPTYGTDQNPFLDFTIKNDGSAATPSTQIQLDWASAYVAGATAPQGWSIASSYFNGDRIVYVFNYDGGPLSPGASVSGRVTYKIQTNAPGGTNQQTVNATAMPTSGDANSSNNKTSSTYYVIGRAFDLGFDYFALQSEGVGVEQGRPLYGPNNGPFIDASVRNYGSGGAPYVQLQFDLDVTQCASMSAGSGWSLTRTWRDGSRNVYLFTWNGGVLPSGQSAAGRFVWQTTSRPAGDTYQKLQGTVTARALPTDGDSNTSSNVTSATFFTRN